MIKEQYVTYSTACLLKEKGFDEKCKGFYSKKKGQVGRFKYWEGDGFSHSDFKDWDYEVMVSAPTQAMAMRWLREKHRLFINISADYEYVDTDWDSDNDEMNIFYKIEIDLFTDKNEVSDETWRKPIEDKEYKTYESAVEQAIKYCLNNLIETPYVERD